MIINIPVKVMFIIIYDISINDFYICVKRASAQGVEELMLYCSCTQAGPSLSAKVHLLGSANFMLIIQC